jgi:hypothetical protein
MAQVRNGTNHNRRHSSGSTFVAPMAKLDQWMLVAFGTRQQSGLVISVPSRQADITQQIPSNCHWNKTR